MRRLWVAPVLMVVVATVGASVVVSTGDARWVNPTVFVTCYLAGWWGCEVARRAGG